MSMTRMIEDRPTVKYRPSRLFRYGREHQWDYLTSADVTVRFDRDADFSLDIDTARVLLAELGAALTEHDNTYRVDLVKAVA
ncbi:hypothetical protein [Nocardia flavorosea]|uniref:Uncharacterized protein n=2 Tax=Nocardia flavorosea TaxID=53429 RepID=A0A846YEK1_9NOCA|nr:hypothetical protein [Nocardia flavorosea]NKY56160.1 hypothetical protein [Nocardia flavorosea]